MPRDTRVVLEYERIPRAEIAPARLARLQALDERQAGRSGQTVLDWGRRAEVCARNFVGVLQVPGLTVEILPKVVAAEQPSPTDRLLARRNLLYMLGYANRLPVRPRELADLDVHRFPLLEAFICAFAERLLAELGRGVNHAYVGREEDVTFVRGRILFQEQSRLATVHRERVAVAYDDYLPDTALNRVLRAGCEQLLLLSQSVRAQRALRTCLLYFAEVSRVHVEAEHAERVALDRNSERFRPLLDFCWLLLAGRSPAPGVGATESFSLLFPMEGVFEQFVAGFLVAHARSIGLEPGRVRAQAKGRPRWLVRDEGGQRGFRLRPDIVIDDEQGGTLTVLDTKWKVLGRDPFDPRQGVAESDLYQLHAYARQYGAPNNALLYPATAGTRAQTYTVEGAEHHRLRIAFVDVSRDLSRSREATLRELGAAVLDRTQPTSVG
jgi:5-methylcytosine-specific restriction enzyme subunit McrC